MTITWSSAQFLTLVWILRQSLNYVTLAGQEGTCCAEQTGLDFVSETLPPPPYCWDHRHAYSWLGLCGSQIRMAPKGSYVWMLSHQGVELLKRISCDIVRVGVALLEEVGHWGRL